MSDQLERWKKRVRQLKTETYALYLACRDPRVPWYARLLVAVVVAYAFSPLDLIPDFIPVLGLLDDLLLVPLGILVARKLIPALVMTECRAQATSLIQQGKPVSRVAGIIIVVVWVLAVVIAGLIVSRLVLG